MHSTILANFKEKSITAAVIAAAAVILCLYFIFDPSEAGWFPRCPFFGLTGLKCPGCGTQRALHQLMAGNLAEACRYNAALIAGLPLIIVLLSATALKTKYPAFYRLVNSRWIIISILAALIAWMVLRNILGC